MAVTSPPQVPGWWSRTWPALALALLSVAMWTGRIRNIAGDDDLTPVGRAVRLALAVSFVVGGLVIAAACWAGWRDRGWRRSAERGPDGWRVGPGLPPWGRRAVEVVAGWTVAVWTVQGIGILLDADHDVGFKAVHTVLMVGSLVVAGVALWGLRRSWPVTDSAPRPRMVG
ncbi:MAG TPA: hypothetical protein VK866_01270 [Acidimicrobiales bacterium]|nr:hypothetical protein [Acidimicrobiales bacterium]